MFEGNDIFVGRIQTIDAHVYFICPDDSREIEFEMKGSIRNLQKDKIEDVSTFPRLRFIARSVVLERVRIAVFIRAVHLKWVSVDLIASFVEVGRVRVSSISCNKLSFRLYPYQNTSNRHRYSACWLMSLRGRVAA